MTSRKVHASEWQSSRGVEVEKWEDVVERRGVEEVEKREGYGGGST